MLCAYTGSSPIDDGIPIFCPRHEHLEIPSARVEVPLTFGSFLNLARIQPNLPTICSLVVVPCSLTDNFFDDFSDFEFGDLLVDDGVDLSNSRLNQK